MAVKLQLGGRVPSLSIPRANVEVGHKGRAVRIGTDVWAKSIAWDDVNKCSVECDQELMISHHLNPTLYYYMLVLRLNTDSQGQVYGDNVTLEYVRMSQKQYDAFNSQVEEIGEFTSITLTKEARRNDKGQDVSYVTLAPSSRVEIPMAVSARLQQLLADPAQIELLWSLVDAATSLSKEQYLKKLELAAGTAPQAVPQPVQQAIPQAVPQPVQQAVPQPVQQAVPQPVQQAVPQPAPQAVPQPPMPTEPIPAQVISNADLLGGVAGDGFGVPGFEDKPF